MNITHEDQQTHITNELLDPIKEVAKFHSAFNQVDGKKPQLLDILHWTLRKELGQEELNEYTDACKDNDLVEVLDSLVDQMYIVCGTVLKHGLQDVFWDAFREVQRSNMSKLDENKKPIVNGENGIMDTTRPTGKILKSEFFVEPDLKKFL
jgi:predicted HAD superfamily Cof-like phosphohydrolase|tara:strand:+ start:488 stop:940 length:453 start_codon:yes stop_codon:yes gene_type:complete